MSSSGAVWLHHLLLPAQVSALASAGGAENLIVLERAKHRPHEVGSVRWAGSTFGPMQKSRLGEHEFEALMRMLDNLVSTKTAGIFPKIRKNLFSKNFFTALCLPRDTARATPTATPSCKRRANPRATC